jgi:cytochrome c5
MKGLIVKTLPASLLLFAALSTATQAQDLTEEQRAAIEARIAPVGEVCLQGESCGGLPASASSATATAPVAGAAAAAVTDGAMAVAAAEPAVDGEATYNMACLACHASGAGGAPIVGNADAWAPRIAKGIDALYASGLNGIAGTSMMAKGGRADLSDAAVKAAVDFMVASSQ